MFKNDLVLDREQYMFIVRTAVILTASNYARRKVAPIIESGVLDELCDLFMQYFNRKTINNKASLREFIFKCSLKIDEFLGSGFSLFCINLVIKKLSFAFTDDFKQLLDAPLNRNELLLTKSKISKMSELNYKNYDSVMDSASKYSIKEGFSCLFEWELKEYNK